MVKSCAAFNCTNRYRKGTNVTFYRFPLSNPQLLAKWLTAVRRQDFQPTIHHYLCSEHFEEDCFLANYVSCRKLKDGAVPSLFKFPNHIGLQQKTSIPRTTTTSLKAARGTTTAEDEMTDPPTTSADNTSIPRTTTTTPWKAARTATTAEEEMTDPPTTSSDNTSIPQTTTTPRKAARASTTAEEETTDPPTSSDNTNDDHNYALQKSPRALRKQCSDMLAKKDCVIKRLRKQLYAKKLMCEKQQQKIKCLNSLVTELKVKIQIKERTAGLHMRIS